MTLCWCSVDALLMLCWCSVDALLMLCWRSVDAVLTLCWRLLSGEATSRWTVLPTKAAKTSIMGKSHSIALGLYKMQHPKTLRLCWRSFSQWGYDHVGFSFAHKSCWYVYYRYMPEHSPWILHDATPKIVDALLTLILEWSDIDINGISYEGGQYFDYVYMP